MGALTAAAPSRAYAYVHTMRPAIIGRGHVLAKKWGGHGRPCDTLRHYSVCAFAWGMPGEIPGENILHTAPANIATPHTASVILYSKTVQFPNSERQCCKYGGLIDRDIYQVGS